MTKAPSEDQFGLIRLRVADLVIFSVGVMFLADAATAMLNLSQFAFSRVSLVVRLLLEVFFLFLLLFKFREIPQFFARTGFLLACFAVSMIAGWVISPNYAWGENLVIFNKLLWLFLCWYVFKTYLKNPQKQAALFQLYEWIIFIQGVSVFLGFLLKIPAFASYGVNRFGYKGLLPAQNETSIFYLIAFFYCVVQVSRHGRGKLLLLITSIAAAMTGTKVGFGILVLLVFFVIFFWSVRYPKIAWRFLVGIALATLLIFVNREAVYERISPTIVLFSSRAKAGQSLPSLITSGRLELLSYPRDALKKYPFIILTGGYDISEQPVEMDPVDIFLGFGLVSAITYYHWLLAIIIVRPVRFDIKLLFAFTLLVVSTFSGHFAYSAIGGTYCAIMLLALHYDKPAHLSSN